MQLRTSEWQPPDDLPGDWAGGAPSPEPEWLVKGMVVKAGIGLLSAMWGRGKTYVAVDLAISVAAGIGFAGHRTVDRSGVLYLSPERPQAIMRRLKHACKQRDVAWDDLPFYRAKSCPKLTDKKAIEKLTTAVGIIADEMQRRHKVRLGLIVIDTMVVAAQWKDENQTAEIQAANAAMRELSNRFGAFVLGIDHMGKDESKGTRGASDKEASMDLVLHLGSGAMVLKKVSDGEQGKKIEYMLRAQRTGTDRDGDPITECSVAWGGAVAERPRPTKPRAHLDDAVTIALDESGESDGGRRIVKQDAVRARFMQNYPGEPEAKRSAFSRALNAALGSKTLETGLVRGEKYLWHPTGPI